ncbi:hypothetical protein BJF79_15470 [Actinomadura sp. CNU-125]|uniref:hypothetical protein n=1 Tax=Actinomadura sp. CNU-125 TaxID=1904961 RepID=UPI000969D149|nr:hypothetical protein [Actinomadura sp. CNU-125]OLT21664.1 hypothetical protein BJF79_15470 [Actinomadura sp. CNU-125]
MTVMLTKPEWGVRCTCPVEEVDVRASEADARRWLRALHFCGNHDAVLVTRAGDGPWRPVETAVTR